MNILDIIILVILAGGLALGIKSGLIKQVMSFVGVVVAFLVSLHLMDSVGVLASNSLGVSEGIAPYIGFVLVFIAVQILVFALVRMVEALIGALKLSVVNRFLGGALGALKAAVVLSVAFLVLGLLNVPERETRDESVLYEPVSAVLPTSWDYISEKLPEVEHLTDDMQDDEEVDHDSTGQDLGKE